MKYYLIDKFYLNEVAIIFTQISKKNNGLEILFCQVITNCRKSQDFRSAIAAL